MAPLAWGADPDSFGLGRVPGNGEMSVAMFPAFCRQPWPRIRSQLIEGTYRPAPVRPVSIPNPDGSQRPFGIPTVLDGLSQSNGRPAAVKATGE